MKLKHSALTVTLLLLGACPAGGGTTDSDSDATTTSTSSTTAEMPTTDAETTIATEATTTEGTTTSDDPTIGDPGDVDLYDACKAVCERRVECGIVTEVKTCTVGCVLEFNEVAEECLPTSLDLLQCLSQSSCPELEGPVEEGPCEEVYGMTLVCTDPGPVGCEQSLSEGEECGLKNECPGEPTQEMVCDADTCTCFEDGMEVASCPADGVCQQGDAIFDTFAACCDSF
ncbi:hypothetical protein [Nannocystis sp. SCPEA4]|uniref:hypothetical protein n=1 Tax=Nannocystis sp. SCPEA4 TaxID=2996787 RepID=UPI00226DD6BD|nr:hypothetical protein [Nannocystis sp. SCPEA4]MCY1062791.1 hypothetical protein [Nannocystis sp. SCPEA4]